MKVLSLSLLLCSFLAGGLFAGEQFFQPMTLDGPDIVAQDPAAESFFWRNTDPETLRYWPLFFLRSEDLKRKIESSYPLAFSVQRRGVNGAAVLLQPLVPRLSIEWRKKQFYLTREGKLWERDHPLNAVLTGIQPPKSPLFIMSDDLPSPRGTPAEGEVVSSADLPVESYMAWLDGLAKSGWMGAAKSVYVTRRAGHPLLELVLRIKEWNIRLLVRGDQDKWREYAEAVSQILNEFHFSGEDLIIDTTYTDRIIVRRVSRGGAEGSGR